VVLLGCKAMIQIAPVPVPVATPAATSPQAAVSVLPVIQGQAIAPIVDRAVPPPPKSEKDQKARSNKERAEGGSGGAGRKRGGNVNISI